MASFLASQNIRREMIQRINKMIDIPYLNERHEAHLITIVVDMCFNALSGQKMPSRNKEKGIEIADDGDSDEQDVTVEIPQGTEESAKEKMISDINARFDLPMLNEDQEQKLIKYFVDALYDLSKDKK